MSAAVGGVVNKVSADPVNAGAGYLLDYGYNSKKNEMFGPASEEEKGEQWDRVLNDAHDRLI